MQTDSDLGSFLFDMLKSGSSAAQAAGITHKTGYITQGKLGGMFERLWHVGGHLAFGETPPRKVVCFV